MSLAINNIDTNIFFCLNRFHSNMSISSLLVSQYSHLDTCLGAITARDLKQAKRDVITRLSSEKHQFLSVSPNDV